MGFLVDQDVLSPDLDVKLSVHAVEECLSIDCRA